MGPQNHLEIQRVIKMTEQTGTGPNVSVKFIYTGFHKNASYFKFVCVITTINSTLSVQNYSYRVRKKWNQVTD